MYVTDGSVSISERYRRSASCIACSARLALADIDQEAVAEPRSSVLVPNDRGLVAQPPDRAVFRGDPMLHVERLAIHVVVVLRFGDPLAVVRMDHLLPDPGVGLPLLRRVAEDRLDLRADVDGRPASPGSFGSNSSRYVIAGISSTSCRYRSSASRSCSSAARRPVTSWSTPCHRRLPSGPATTIAWSCSQAICRRRDDPVLDVERISGVVRSRGLRQDPPRSSGCSMRTHRSGSTGVARGCSR